MTQRKRWSQDLSLLPLYSFSYCIHVWIILCIVNDDDHFTLTINNDRKMHWHECLKFWKKSPTSESKVAILPWCAKIQTRRLRDLQTLCIISVGKPEITQKSVSALFLCHAHKLMFNKGENVISVLILVPGWPPTRNRNIREYIKPQEITASILPKIHLGNYFTLFQTSPFLSKNFWHLS